MEYTYLNNEDDNLLEVNGSTENITNMGDITDADFIIDRKDQTYYQILGVENNATDKEIKNKYLLLCKIHHPDKQTNNDMADTKLELYLKIKKAYKILSNKEYRDKYDYSLRSLIFNQFNDLKNQYDIDNRYLINRDYVTDDNSFDHDKFMKDFSKERKNEEINPDNYHVLDTKTSLDKLLEDRDKDLHLFSDQQNTSLSRTNMNNDKFNDKFNHIFNCYKQTNRGEMELYQEADNRYILYGSNSNDSNNGKNLINTIYESFDREFGEETENIPKANYDKKITNDEANIKIMDLMKKRDQLTETINNKGIEKFMFKTVDSHDERIKLFE